MASEQISMMDLLIETHIGLDRQGPGSPEITAKALSFLDNRNSISKVADLACGTGGQTMVLAENIPGDIVGVDICPAFIDVLNDNAQKANLGGRVKGVVGSMDDLSFGKEEIDLIWSEGAIDNIGFEKGLRYWYGFLKKGGYVAVSCPSWFTEEHPIEVEKFWAEAGSGLNTVEYNISVMQKIGYRFVAAFVLPENCWTDNYFIPREEKEQELLKKHAGNKIVEEYIENSKYEMEIYAKYKQHYGYAFYIGQKI